MPRKARIDAPGALHHVIVRGIERRKIFLDDTDRDDFIERLSNIIDETQTACFAWALIPNPLVAKNRECRCFPGHAASFNRICAHLQQAPSPAGTSVSKSLQIHSVSGRCVSS